MREFFDRIMTAWCEKHKTDRDIRMVISKTSPLGTNVGNEPIYGCEIFDCPEKKGCEFSDKVRYFCPFVQEALNQRVV